MQKYKEEIMNKYWKAYKMMKDNKLGYNTSISIAEQNESHEISLCISYNF
jgi:hypothetical protein